ncbi:phage tail protein [Streptomyces sp. NPDC086519]|uniref:phage tail protein n=1 Tax=Streptomyces sp. NPDC086519 TaxID=3154863 RepID=UPI00341DA2B9
MDRQDPGTTVWFSLSIDGEDLGYFNGCEGLSSQVEIEQRQEGGNNGFVWQLPTRVSFSHIRLTRPLTPDTTKVAKWISSVQTGIERPTGQITALRADGSEVARWGLLDVLPVSWQGPSLDAGSPSIATEVLEIAHHGFTD